MRNLNRSAKVITYDIPLPVSVRKYEVDTNRLKATLKLHKKKSGLSNKVIADTLGLPLTKVEHWFRSDKSFAVPDSDYWLTLKKLLTINTDEFDESILTYEIRPGVYEKSNRVYGIDGLAPTLTASDDIKILIDR